VKQTPFAGSHRELRAAVLRLLLAAGPRPSLLRRSGLDLLPVGDQDPDSHSPPRS